MDDQAITLIINNSCSLQDQQAQNCADINQRSSRRWFHLEIHWIWTWPRYTSYWSQSYPRLLRLSSGLAKPSGPWRWDFWDSWLTHLWRQQLCEVKSQMVTITFKHAQ